MSHTTVTARHNRTNVTRTRAARRAAVIRHQSGARRIGTAGAILAACVLALMYAIGAAYPAHGATVPASSTGHVSPTGAYALTPARLSAMFTPCQVEDGSGCYWDAGRAGNGAGASFTAVVTVPGVVCVDYWTGPASEDYCTPDPYAVP